MRKLSYPDDLEFIITDIKRFVQDSITEDELRNLLIQLLENEIIEPIWDDTYGREVGLSGRVKLKWNNDWEIVTDNRELNGVFINE